jgi:hypothetical protein
MIPLFLITLKLFVISKVVAHSWLHCVDYNRNAPLTVGNIQNNQCRSFPRGIPSTVTFGEDRGYDYRPGSGRACRNSFAAVTIYQRGQTYRLLWPAKNHISARCTNPYIQDQALQLFLYPVNQFSSPDPSLTTWRSSQYLFFDFKRNGQGFQNCPDACPITDRLPCFGDITIPNSLPLGRYKALWYWVFNPNEVFTHCFDIEIVAPTAKAPTTKAPTTKAPTTKAPTTKAPTTKAPTAKAPTPKAPTAKAPTTKAPTAKAPTAKAPTAKAPTTKAPTTKAPTTKAPTTKAPTAKAPTAKAPTAKAPTAKAPTTKAPTTKAPTTKAPTTKAPTTKAPTTKAPTTKAPTTKAPTTKAPTTKAPTTKAPICATLYQQCGGQGWTGTTCCQVGTCQVVNYHYSQCRL